MFYIRYIFVALFILPLFACTNYEHKNKQIYNQNLRSLPDEYKSNFYIQLINEIDKWKILPTIKESRYVPFPSNHEISIRLYNLNFGAIDGEMTTFCAPLRGCDIVQFDNLKTQKMVNYYIKNLWPKSEDFKKTIHSQESIDRNFIPRLYGPFFNKKREMISTVLANTIGISDLAIGGAFYNYSFDYDKYERVLNNALEKAKLSFERRRLFIEGVRWYRKNKKIKIKISDLNYGRDYSGFYKPIKENINNFVAIATLEDEDLFDNYGASAIDFIQGHKKFSAKLHCYNKSNKFIYNIKYPNSIQIGYNNIPSIQISYDVIAKHKVQLRYPNMKHDDGKLRIIILDEGIHFENLTNSFIRVDTIALHWAKSISVIQDLNIVLSPYSKSKTPIWISRFNWNFLENDSGQSKVVYNTTIDKLKNIIINAGVDVEYRIANGTYSHTLHVGTRKNGLSLCKECEEL